MFKRLFKTKLNIENLAGYISTKRRVEIQEEFYSYLTGLGFDNTVTPNDKVYIHTSYADIKVFLCFFPCTSGVMILSRKGKELYRDTSGNLDEFKEELAKYRKNE